MTLVFLRALVFFAAVAVGISLLRRVLSNRSMPPPRSRPSDPYAVLGVSRSATAEEIREAFRREIAKYHPDKVAHLGEDLQALARERTSELVNAYERLTKGRA